MVLLLACLFRATVTVPPISFLSIDSMLATYERQLVAFAQSASRLGSDMFRALPIDEKNFGQCTERILRGGSKDEAQ